MTCEVYGKDPTKVALFQKHEDDIWDDEGYSSSKIPHIKNVVEWMYSHDCGDIIPEFFEFSDDYMIVEKMTPVVDPEWDDDYGGEMLVNSFTVKEFKNFVSQAERICEKLNKAKVHHNDLKFENFVWKYDDNDEKKYYIIDFGYSQVFDDDFDSSHISDAINNKEYRKSHGFRCSFDEKMNFINFYGNVLGTFEDKEQYIVATGIREKLDSLVENGF